jgi:hypothetical protein
MQSLPIRDEPEDEVSFQYKLSLGRVACLGLTTSVHEAEKLSLNQIEAFLNASEEIRFEGENREQVYGWVEQVLRRQQYPKQGRKARG